MSKQANQPIPKGMTCLFGFKHFGPVLVPSEDSFDAGGSAWGCAFADKEDSRTVYLYYSGSADRKWTQAAIGLAVSEDGMSFRKLEELNPVLEGGADEFNSGLSITPAVTRVGNHYYMILAGSRRSSIFPRLSRRTRIGVAHADDPRGPWEVLGAIASPEFGWEGLSIDLGPGLVNIGDGEFLVYYSNSVNLLPLSLLGVKYLKFLHRCIGILQVKIRSPKSISAHKYEGNPLHLNGPKGSSAESVFCPGHLLLSDVHFLVPAMGTYSVGFPFHQYIGITASRNAYLENARTPSVLIDGPSEGKEILNAKSQLAFDTPSPLVRNDTIYLYYSVMDRQNAVWKTALSLIDKRSLEDCAF